MAVEGLLLMIRWIYYFAAPITGIFSLLGFIPYNHQLLNAGVGGKICWVWFLLLTIVTTCQIPMHLGLNLVRGYKPTFDKHLKKGDGIASNPDKYYKTVRLCTIILCFVCAINGMFLVAVQFSLVAFGEVNQRFTVLFFVVWCIHATVLLTRLVIAAENQTRQFYYFPFWKKEGLFHFASANQPSSVAVSQPSSPHVVRRVRELAFYDVAKVFNSIDLFMVLVGFLVTYTLTDYDSATDKVTSFFHSWHPCLLIDHYPASIVGLLLIGAREVTDCLFQVMLFVYTSLRSGTATTIGAAVVLTLSQVGLFCIVNAFSAGLYTRADIGVTPETYVFTANDRHNVGSHATAYVAWMAASQTIFTYLMWLVFKFNLPFKSVWKKYVWIGFFVLSSIVVWTMCAAMGVVIVNGSDDWLYNPQTFLQRYLSFAHLKLEFAILMLIPAPIQRLIMPKTEGLRLRFTTDRAEAKHGSMGLPERLFCIIFWVLGILTFITYSFTSVPYSPDLIIPIAMGFRVKPFVYLFAPGWFAGCLFLGYSIWLTILRARMEERSITYVTTLRVVGIFLFLFSLLCLLIIIPLWESSSPVLVVALGLLLVWIAITQGPHKATAVYCAIYIALALLSILHRRLAVMWSVLLMILLMCYGIIFPRHKTQEIFVSLEYGEVININPVVELMRVANNMTHDPAQDKDKDKVSDDASNQANNTNQGNNATQGESTNKASQNDVTQDNDPTTNGGLGDLVIRE